jgi:hypothetical protein
MSALILMGYMVAESFDESDVSNLKLCNQCLCGYWYSIPACGSRYVALYKKNFRRRSCTSVFFWPLWFLLPIKLLTFLISKIIWSSEGAFTSSEEIKRAGKIYVKYE